MKLTGYHSPGDFILRSPVLPVNNIENMPIDLSAFVLELMKNDFFVNGIYIASYPLYQEAIKWKEGKTTDGKEEEKLLLSLFKYWLRMSTRCTPYGSFAGCALGQLTGETAIQLRSKESHRHHLRIDMNFMAEFVSHLIQQPEIMHSLRYYPNNSSYRIKDDYRYIEYSVSNNFRSYKVSEVNCDEYITKVLNKAEGGAKISELREELMSDEITCEEADAFIEELIGCKILISELEPTITGEPFLDVLKEKLKKIDGAKMFSVPLEQVSQRLLTKSLSRDKVRELYDILQSLLQTTSSKDLLQVDLQLTPQKNCIKEEVIQSIIEASQKLMRINMGDPAVLRSFKKRFYERYETAEMPLMHVLDPEVGIGYDTATSENIDTPVLLDGIDAHHKPEQENFIAWNNYRDFQLQKLNEALVSRSEEITLSEKELEALSVGAEAQTPDSFSIIGTLLGTNVREIDNGNWRFHFMSLIGPSAANFIARFCHLDESITKKVKQYVADEESHKPDVVFAEIVHMPQARVGNIAIRPTLRQYEIPYVSNAGVKMENQILVSDLYISIRNNQIILRSKRLNKRVVPRLTNAHNFSGAGNLPVYKFLCDLQHQNLMSRFSWDWGKLTDCSYLPRVVYGKIILKKAQWTLEQKNHKALEKLPPNSLTAYFAKWRHELRIPRYVTLSEGDNELLIDMENQNCLKLLRDSLMKQELVRLEEFLAVPDQCFVQDEEGSKFNNQIIIPVGRKKIDSPPSSFESPALSGSALQRVFIAGSEWLYIKVYCGNKSSEKVLKEVIRPLTKSLLKNEVIDKWFFIRYSDPDPHLRVRFHGKSSDHYSVILKQINASMNSFVQAGLVQRIQLDTYQREIERYGHHTMELSEAFFFYDSEAIIDFIAMLEPDLDEKFRWLFALRGVDMMLDSFQFLLQEKITLMKMLSQGFLSEFSDETYLRKQINDKYRTDTQTIFNFLNPENDSINEIGMTVDLFKHRSAHFAQLYQKIMEMHPTSFKRTRDELMPSYLHMFLNRIFQSNHRKQELVIYNYLYRYYQSLFAITKSGSAKKIDLTNAAVTNA